MDSLATQIAILGTPEGLISLLTLMFLELALGIDNLVFIAITSDRLPASKQHIGRRLGLAAAMVMRCLLLICVVWIMSLTITLVTLPFGVVDGTTPIGAREIIFLAGGLYLIYKGCAELKVELSLSEFAIDVEEEHERKTIGLPQAIGTIMVMDIVFSLDSVITAAGLSGEILIMCIAVILAILIMIIFADPISNFINRNVEIKILALTFIVLVGVMLFAEGFHIEEVAGMPLNTVLYCMMAFGLLVSILIMVRQRNMEKRLNAQKVAAASMSAGITAMGEQFGAANKEQREAMMTSDDDGENGGQN